MKREHQETDRGKVGLLEVGTRGDQEGFGGQWQALNCAAANKNNLTGCLAEELRIMNALDFWVPFFSGKFMPLVPAPEDR